MRTTGNPLDYAKSVREAVWRVDKDQPIWRFRAMEQDLDSRRSSAKKAMMWLTGSFALVALLVAAVGIYGVLSYTMSQRTQEVGIRIALGANASDVTRMVVGEGAKLVGIRGGRRIARRRRRGAAASEPTVRRAADRRGRRSSS